MMFVQQDRRRRRRLLLCLRVRPYQLIFVFFIIILIVRRHGPVDEVRTKRPGGDTWRHVNALDAPGHDEFIVHDSGAVIRKAV